MSSGRVTVQLPRVLCELTACSGEIEVEGATVGEALRDLVRREPALGLHLFDDTGALRRHVRCFRNDPGARDIAAVGDALSAGDRLTVINSVAGG